MPTIGILALAAVATGVVSPSPRTLAGVRLPEETGVAVCEGHEQVRRDGSRAKRITFTHPGGRKFDAVAIAPPREPAEIPAVILGGGPEAAARIAAEYRLYGDGGYGLVVAGPSKPGEGVGARATDALLCANYARKAFGRAPYLLLRGRDCVAGAHAFDAQPSAFHGRRSYVEDAPLSWRDMESEDGGIPADLSVEGAVGRYDWGDLLAHRVPAPRLEKSFTLRKVAPAEVRRNAAGNTLVDFGGETFGWFEFLPPPGTTGSFEVVLGELVDAQGSVWKPNRSSARIERLQGRITGRSPAHRAAIAPGRDGCGLSLPPDVGTIMPFRYAEIVSAPYEISAANVRQVAVEYGYDMKESSFDCSDGRLVKVWDFCKRTIPATSAFGLFVDGDRERLPYEGDAFVAQSGAYAAFADPRPATATLEYLMEHPAWPTEGRITMVIMAWEDWMRRGNADFLKRHYETLRDERLMTRFARESDGLLLTGGERGKGSVTGCGDIVDWPACERDGFRFAAVNAVVNAYYYKALLCMADIAKAVDRPGEADDFAARAARVLSSYQKAFLDPRTGLYVDGEGVSHSSLHANAIALAFGLVPPERRRAVADFCASRGMACSVYYARYLFEALAENGREDAVIGYMTADGDRSWLGMMRQGATSTMESWNPRVKPNLDFNHVWGVTPLFAVSRFVLGAKPLAPGWTKVSVTPRLGPLKWAEGVVPTIHGGIRIRAERMADGSVQTTCTPPPGVEVVGLNQAGADGTFALVTDGKPAAAFEIGATPDEKSAKAAADDVALFNKYLKEVTGAALPTKGSEDAIIRIDLKPIDDLTTRYDWKIEFPTANLMRVEATTSSLFAALRQLLEDGCDARFLGAENCMFQFEPRRDAAVATRSRHSARRNYSLYRALSVKSGHEHEMGIDGDRLFEFSHGIPLYAFPSRKYERTGWPAVAMPEHGGKRLAKPKTYFANWQPCYSNPEAAKIAASNVLEALRANPGRKSLTLAVNDTGGYCQCTACRAMDAGAEKSIFSNDKENHSASYYTFANRVIGEVEKEFPGLRYGALAYTGTVMPPPFPVNRKIVPMMTFTTHATSMDPEVGAAQDAVIRRWGEKVDATGIWEYDWGRAFYVPRVDFAGSARRLKFLYENGGRAYFAENFHDMLDGPKVYLKARLLEDVDRDPEAVLDEWFVRFAGKAAAPELRSIYRRCEEFWRSEPMKQSAFWRMRRCICITPSDQVFPAIEHGFTEGLLASAQRVRDLASTPGGRRRAEILVRHFELLNCIAAFRGSAWQTPYEGEVKTAESAAKMLNAFADAAPGLFDAWNRVERYFSEADFAEPGIYLRRRKVSLDPLAECAVMAAEAMSHIESQEVADAMRRIAGLDSVPGSVKRLFATLTSCDIAENSFSNPGFARPLSEMHVTTYKSCRAEIVPCDDAGGGRALRVLPDRAGGYAECQLTERLDEGTWLVTARIRGCKRVELVARRQKDGRNREDGVFSHRAVPHGDWRSFAKVGRVTKGMDGLNIAFKGVGVEDDGLVVADLRVTRLSF